MKKNHIEYINTNIKPVGPYSQGTKIGPFIFTAGQGPIDPNTGKSVGGDIKKQTKRTLDNLRLVLEKCGASFDDVVKVTIFLTDFTEFDDMNKIYKEYFKSSKPARSAAEVKNLIHGIKIEVEAIAVLPSAR